MSVNNIGRRVSGAGVREQTSASAAQITQVRGVTKGIDEITVVLGTGVQLYSNRVLLIYVISLVKLSSIIPYATCIL